MSTFISFVVIGVVSGSIYSLAGVGLVLTFKTSRIFNFAHGALGTVAAYLFYTLVFEHNLPWPLGAAITLGVAAPIIGIVFESFGRGLTRASVIWQIAATIGLLLSVEALFTIIYGVTPRQFNSFLPTSGFELGQVNISYEQLIIVLVSFFSTGILYASFRLTRTGIAMRAVVEGPELLALAQTSPTFVRRAAWIIGCFFAMLSGLLIAPSVSLDSTTLTLLIFQAFGAAAIGGFSSIPLTWAGGILLGVAASILTEYGPTGSFLGGLSVSLPMVVLVVVLVVIPSRLRIRDVVTLVRPIPWTAPGRVQVVAGVVVVAVFAVIPALVGYQLDTYTLLLCSMILFMSLGLLVRVAGQASLCQVSFAAIGAVAFSKLAVNSGLPWLPAMLLGALIATPIGFLLAIPAIRVAPLYLGLITLGFGLILQQTFYTSSWMFGDSNSSLSMPEPDLLRLNTNTGFYYLVLFITVIVAVTLVALGRSRLGRLLRGVAESPVTMRAAGHGVEVALILVFTISAFFAGLAGELQGMVYHQASSLDFDPSLSFVYFAVTLISIGAEPWYALFPAAGLSLLPLYITSGSTINYLTLTFGVGAILGALAKQPQLKLQVRIHGFFDRFAAVPIYQRVRSLVPGWIAEGRGGQLQRVNLEVKNLVVRFGGLSAVDGMSLAAPAGRISGLIGPNGAGKTTTLNSCSGFVTPARGAVLVDDRNVVKSSVAQRARLGLGRTFQLMEMCDTLTVWENVVIAREAGMARGNVLRQIVGRRGDRKEVEKAVSLALARCELSEVAGVQVGHLSSSQRRFVEISRCLASGRSMLLLDEPSSGLDRVATERLGQILRSIVDEDGIGVLLVEHDMSLVMSVSDYIYVMDFGKPIFEGTPEEVQASEVVRAAYLGGSAAREIELDIEDSGLVREEVE